MKLKKFAAMMLAGVMAVSMLAGCSTGIKPEEPTEETVSGVNAAAVIAALDKKATEDVTFSAGSGLQTVVDKASVYVKDGIVDDFDLALLNKVDEDINSVQDYLPAVGTTTANAEDAKAQTVTFIVKSDLIGASADATVKDLAAKVDEAYVMDGWLKMNALPEESAEFTDVAGDDFYFTFAYTADMAIACTANEDGQVTYYAGAPCCV